MSLQREQLKNVPEAIRGLLWQSAEGAYRPDIDGLRAIAIIGVVWFHAFPRNWPAGFIGVDIFFVISGYLISTILFRQIPNGTFSFYDFFGRRMRRILPALGVVLFTVFIVGWGVCAADEFYELGKQIVAGWLFFANVLFWQQQGYFDIGLEFKPLLHLWSLGLEEQFYLFYPTALYSVFRLRWKPTIVISGGALISLVWCICATKQASGFAFFMLPTRLWELCCGSLVALFVLRKPQLYSPTNRQHLTSHFASLCGFALVVTGFISAPASDFPGYWALLPTSGTCLLILAGPNGFLNKLLLSFRPLVFVGLVSYPLYLWHWPLISFEHILAGERPEVYLLNYALLISFGLSVVTFLIVERPLRKISIGLIYRYFIPVTILGAATGITILFASGFPGRLAASAFVRNEGEIGHSKFFEVMNNKFFPCEPPELNQNVLKSENFTRCHQSKRGTNYDIVLLGDSHAEHLFYGLAMELPKNNILYVTNFGIPTEGNTNLEPLYPFILRYGKTKPADIILCGAWIQHYPKEGIITAIGNLVQRFLNTGHRVFLTDDLPFFSFEPTICKMNRRFSNRTFRCRESSKALAETKKWTHQTLEQIAANTGAKILYSYDFFKDGDGFSMAKDGLLFYRDRHHLNVNGSMFVAKRLNQTGQLKYFEDRKE